jgi:secreted trypsin-like serine protease
MARPRINLGISLGLLVAPGCVTSPVELAQADQAIIGGQTAAPADFPTVVALENTPGNWFCTGTLIDKDWILTAAHCVEGETAAGMKIRFDDADINDTTGGRVIAVAEIHSNTAFNFEDWDNDIALIKLATSVTDRTVTPIHRAAVAPGTAIIEVGYGDADNNGGGAGLLRKLATANIDCAIANDPAVSGANLLCFDATDGTSSCYGDSGGPAFITVNGSYEVAGVTSGGTADQCTAGFDLYTSVAGELAFVDGVLGGMDPGGEPEPDPMGGEPTPPPGGETPDPDGEHSASEDGGCSTGGGNGGLLLIAGALMLVRRRRR